MLNNGDVLREGHPAEDNSERAWQELVKWQFREQKEPELWKQNHLARGNFQASQY